MHRCHLWTQLCVCAVSSVTALAQSILTAASSTSTAGSTLSSKPWFLTLILIWRTRTFSYGRTTADCKGMRMKAVDVLPKRWWLMSLRECFLYALFILMFKHYLGPLLPQEVLPLSCGQTFLLSEMNDYSFHVRGRQETLQIAPVPISQGHHSLNYYLYDSGVNTWTR